MPYIVGHLQALTQAANVALSIIPTVYSTQKNIAILNPEKEVQSIPINQSHGVNIDFDTELMKIEVKAGVNFSIQKSRALDQLLGLNQSLPAFAQFMSVKGLPVILDNLEIRGIDQLKQDAQAFMQQLEQQQQMQMQQAQATQNQPNPIMEELKLENKRIEQREKELQIESEVKMAKLALEKQAIENKHLKALLDVQEKKNQANLNLEKAKIEGMLKAADLSIKMRTHH